MSAPSITVRESRPEDVADIQRIYAHHVDTGTASFEEVPPSVDDMAERRAAVLAFGAPYLVAELNGVVQGYAYAGPFRARSAYRYTVENSIYVEPAAAGNGIGTRLLGALVDLCTDLGYRQMIAVIGGSDNAGSIALHRKLGFTHAGTLNATGLKFGGWVDTVLMQRALGDGAANIPQERPQERRK